MSELPPAIFADNLKPSVTRVSEVLSQLHQKQSEFEELLNKQLKDAWADFPYGITIEQGRVMGLFQAGNLEQAEEVCRALEHNLKEGSANIFKTIKHLHSRHLHTQTGLDSLLKKASSFGEGHMIALGEMRESLRQAKAEAEGEDTAESVTHTETGNRD